MLTPTSEADLAALVTKRNAPLRLCGGGTRDIGRPVEGTRLSTRGLSGVTLYEPGALTLVAQAGTPVSEIEALLRAENQRLPFEPMDHRALLGTTGEPTIGGVIAANVSGPRRVAVGAARDFLLGVRFVDGIGQIVKNGGRVMKNVTGYDLVKLMAGSHGTLGILTEVSMKVLPAAEAAATLAIEGLDAPTAVSVMSSALGSPFDVTGAAYRAQTQTAYIRIEGFEQSVGYRTEALSKKLVSFGAPRLHHGEAHDDLWRGIRDVADLSAVGPDIWRSSVKPSDALAVLAATGAQDFQLDWGGGLIWIACKPGTDLRAQLAGITGHATLVRASTDTRKRIAPFHPEPAPIAAISKGLRDKFDPKGILNPGIML
ncbi:FAD-binding protein [Cognatiyoonia sp.]|uniref:FAD-binding protein n=1 Tax=Cognatiyoonia sp. TaxID=2211652 RepID=UPI003F697540